MTTKKRETSKRGTKKLKLKKETLKDLGVARGKGPKGGLFLRTAACAGGGGGGTVDITGCACQQTNTCYCYTRAC